MRVRKNIYYIDTGTENKLVENASYGQPLIRKSNEVAKPLVTIACTCDGIHPGQVKSTTVLRELVGNFRLISRVRYKESGSMSSTFSVVVQYVCVTCVTVKGKLKKMQTRYPSLSRPRVSGYARRMKVSHKTVEPPSMTWSARLEMPAQPAPGECHHNYKHVYAECNRCVQKNRTHPSLVDPYFIDNDRSRPGLRQDVH